MAADNSGGSDDKIVRLTGLPPTGETVAAQPATATAQAPAQALAPATPAPTSPEGAKGQRQGAGQGGAKRRARMVPGMAPPATGRRKEPDPALVGDASQRLGAQRPARSRARRRYRGIVLSFLVFVLSPVIAAGVYLYVYAADQFHSTAAFSIRSEEQGSTVSGLLGAIGAVSSGSASDPDVLFEYIRSQDIVEQIDAELDLRSIFSRATEDPVFALSPGGTIEDLFAQWMRMVDVVHESSNGILTIEARAFTPEDAQAITGAIVEKSSLLINRLSQVAHADTLRFATQELDEAKMALFEVRQRLTVFRRTNQIVDPVADAAGQLGILTALQTELARALIDRDTVASFAQPDDPRIASADIRIEAITTRIDAERAALQRDTGDDDTLDIFSEYENLLVEQEFAQASYTAALAALAEAQAEARRQARFVAVHIEPTLAEQSLYPQRPVLIGLTLLFAMLAWAVLMLAYYNVRDNR
jgi:capsular polysaccharide transport system permease protein